MSETAPRASSAAPDGRLRDTAPRRPGDPDSTAGASPHSSHSTHGSEGTGGSGARSSRSSGVASVVSSNPQILDQITDLVTSARSRVGA